MYFTQALGPGGHLHGILASGARVRRDLWGVVVSVRLSAPQGAHLAHRYRQNGEYNLDRHPGAPTCPQWAHER